MSHIQDSCEPDVCPPRQGCKGFPDLDEQMREKTRISGWGESDRPWGQDEILHTVSATQSKRACEWWGQAGGEVLGRGKP